jgi:uncharacterized protein
VPRRRLAGHDVADAERYLADVDVLNRALARIPDQGVSWDYTTWLNIAFLALAAALIVRFARTGGLAMLPMMGGSPQGHDHRDARASHGH